MARSTSPTVRSLLGGLALVGSIMLPTQASAQWLGEHPLPDLQWYTIEGDHFYVHYQVSKNTNSKHYIDSTWAARKALKVSDEMYEPMCEQLGYYLKEKTHVVILENTDDLEGFTIPSFDWIVVSANPGGMFYRSRGRMEWFSDVMAHEWAHVVSLKENNPQTEHTFGVVLGGLYRDGVNNNQSGVDIFIGNNDPWWWVEGGAEFWSEESGYNWWTASRDTTIRNAVYDDRLLNYDEWRSRVFANWWRDGEHGYQQGYSMALYMRERFGPDAMSRMAYLGGKKWRPNYEALFEEVTGVPLRTAYDDWVDYITMHYGEVRDRVEDEGLVEGRELLDSKPAWEFSSPDERDEWYDKKWYERETERMYTGGTYDAFPKYSPDGKWFAEHARGRVVVQRRDEHTIGILNGDYVSDPSLQQDRQVVWKDQSARFYGGFYNTYDFVPGADQLVITGREDDLQNGRFTPHFDGYDWDRLYLVDLEPKTDKRKHHGEKEEFENFDFKRKERNERITMIPNTERGTDPRVSPDGSRIAYFEYRDGTMNLVLIDKDGENKKRLTEWSSGQWLQHADWSPDGTHLVVAVFHNYQQNLYKVNVETAEITPLTQDKWEQQDAIWHTDGNIYFSADPTGIFNIYRLNPDNGDVTQITNVLGSAQMPSITPEGNLLYVNFVGHGWKTFGVNQSEFMEKPVTDQFVTKNLRIEEARADLAYQEDLSHYEAQTTKYKSLRAKNWLNPIIIPIVRLENQSQVNVGLSTGAQILMFDYLENHNVVAYAELGEDTLFQGSYTWSGWYPRITIAGIHYRGKFDYAFLLDDDDNTNTTDDQSVFDGKNHTYQNAVFGTISYPWNGRFSPMLYGQAMEFGFRGTDDTSFRPFMRSWTAGTRLTYSEISQRYSSSANVRGGRVVDLDLSVSNSDLVFADQKGYDTDDGELIDQYTYGRGLLDWTEQLPAPTFGSKWLAGRGPALQLNGQVGIISRNVQFQDEFRAGGVHPYFSGSGAIQPNNQFAGYPGWSLSGETMVTMSAAYRVPVVQHIKKNVGPLFLENVVAQVGGTAGNLWSYKLSDEAAADPSRTYSDSAGQQVAYNPEDVRREIPFVDEAYKNGNRLLFDASVEVRVSALLMNSQFNSFARLAWGFNEISGINDVNEDDIADTTDPGTGNSVSGETEKPGPRLYIGIGTGW